MPTELPKRTETKAVQRDGNLILILVAIALFSAFAGFNLGKLAAGYEAHTTMIVSR